MSWTYIAIGILIGIIVLVVVLVLSGIVLTKIREMPPVFCMDCKLGFVTKGYKYCPYCGSKLVEMEEV